VTVRVSGCQRQLPAAVEHSLFQISQEGLWNVVRHAQASQAWLSLAFSDGEVRLSVADDGAGDPVAAARSLASDAPLHGGHGLRNMGERTAELDGVIRARRRRGGGLRITVSIPAWTAQHAADTETAAP
jgi:signal transduction histidine kinase